MKYPQTQFTILVDSLRVLAQYIDVASVNPNRLHSIVYTQLVEDGQDHNKLIIVDGVLQRSAKIDPLTNELVFIEGQRVLENKAGFANYPVGCNDTHIATAVKQAIKQLIS